MKVWIVIAAVGTGSYLFRISMLVLARRVGVPKLLERASTFAVPTAFAALAMASLLHQTTTTTAGVGAGVVGPFVAVLAAVTAVRRTGSSHAALLVGMPTLWIVSALWR